MGSRPSRAGVNRGIGPTERWLAGLFAPTRFTYMGFAASTGTARCGARSTRLHESPNSATRSRSLKSLLQWTASSCFVLLGKFRVHWPYGIEEGNARGVEEPGEALFRFACSMSCATTSCSSFALSAVLHAAAVEQTAASSSESCSSTLLSIAGRALGDTPRSSATAWCSLSSDSVRWRLMEATAEISEKGASTGCCSCCILPICRRAASTCARRASSSPVARSNCEQRSCSPHGLPSTVDNPPSSGGVGWSPWGTLPFCLPNTPAE
mmetsp:Transcript_1441/g.5119  ORF Transcript_1441/g.5119 Transcript_1441/m.5119 type:complete len:267 (-) Transcript_1441:70-870(-)